MADLMGGLSVLRLCVSGGEDTTRRITPAARTVALGERRAVVAGYAVGDRYVVSERYAVGERYGSPLALEAI